jgi:hypothetical protein
MRKKVWITAGDIVLCAKRDFQDEKVDIVHKYSADEARNLKQYGELPETARINETAVDMAMAGGDEDDDIGIDFDVRRPSTWASALFITVRVLSRSCRFILSSSFRISKLAILYGFVLRERLASRIISAYHEWHRAVRCLCKTFTSASRALQS